MFKVVNLFQGWSTYLKMVKGLIKSVFSDLKLLRIQLYRNLVDLPCGRDDLLDNLDS